MPKVGIVISNYNGWQDTLVCLDSLQKQTFTDFEIILLDDASPNDSVAQLRDKLPANTVFLPQQQNLGFAAVNNVGIRRALADGCDFVLLLNNDTAVAPDMLETLLRETRTVPSAAPKCCLWIRRMRSGSRAVRWILPPARSNIWAATPRMAPPLAKNSR